MLLCARRGHLSEHWSAAQAREVLEGVSDPLGLPLSGAAAQEVGPEQQRVESQPLGSARGTWGASHRMWKARLETDGTSAVVPEELDPSAGSSLALSFAILMSRIS